MMISEEKRFSFTLNLPPVTKKNHGNIVLVKGRPMLIPSKQYKEYEQKALWLIPKIKEPIDFKVNLKCVYYMPTRRRVDLVNLLEATCDLLVKGQILADDNCNIVASHDGSCVMYDKENPRTEVTIDALY